jgi:hypothetical protein
MKDKVSPAVLRALLSYDPLTGILTWLPRPRSMFSTQRSFSTWNARYAGTVAGRDCHGYVVVMVLGRNYFAHQIAWAMHYDAWPRSEKGKWGIEHDNRVRNDNRIANLRNIPQAQQSLNRSGTKGYSYRPTNGTWVAYCDGTYVYGLKTEAEARDKRAELLRKRGFMST